MYCHTFPLTAGHLLLLAFHHLHSVNCWDGLVVFSCFVYFLCFFFVLFAFLLSLGLCLGFYLPILLLVYLMGEILPTDICLPVLCVVEWCSLALLFLPFSVSTVWRFSLQEF
jgi:hypothetical protein